MMNLEYVMKSEYRKCKRCGFGWIGRRNAATLLVLAVLSFGFVGGLSAQLLYTPATFSSGSAISASGMNTLLNNNYVLMNTQLTKLDSANWFKVSGGVNYAGGNVGIGNPNPAYRLDVQPNIADFAMQIYNTNTTNSGLAGNGMGLKIKIATLYNTHLIGFYNSSDVMAGSIYMIGSGTGVTYATTSDRRLKENIVDTRYTIADLMKIQVRDFNFISDPSKKLGTGFLAQELAPLVPDAVTIPAKPEDAWSVDYGRLTPVLVKAVQDQQKLINSLQAENADLKKRLAAIEKKLGL